MKRKILCFLILCLSFLSFSSFAVEITLLHLGGCKIVEGVIIETNKKDIKVLTSNGEIKIVPRFKVASLALYRLPFIEGETTYLGGNWEVTLKNKKTPLLGYITRQNSTHILFLDSHGKEHSILHSDILGIQPNQELPKPKAQTSSWKLRYPLYLETCEEIKKHSSFEPWFIARHSEQIKEYFDEKEELFQHTFQWSSRQKFYVRSYFWDNETRLGSYFLLNPSHSNIGERKGSLLPFIQNSGYSDIFGMSWNMISGPYPWDMALYGEPIPQLFLDFKFTYVSGQILWDPTMIFIDNYDWNKEDLEKDSFSWFHSAGAFVGLDWDRVRVRFANINIYLGFRKDNLFHKKNFSLTGAEIGLWLTPRLHTFAYFMNGSSSLPDEHDKIQVAKFHLKYENDKEYSISTGISYGEGKAFVVPTKSTSFKFYNIHTGGTYFLTNFIAIHSTANFDLLKFVETKYNASLSLGGSLSF